MKLSVTDALDEYSTVASKMCWNPVPPIAGVSTFPGTGMVTIDGQATGVESDGSTAITVAVGTHVVGFEGKGTKQSIEVRGDQPLKIKL